MLAVALHNYGINSRRQTFNRITAQCLIKRADVLPCRIDDAHRLDRNFRFDLKVGLGGVGVEVDGGDGFFGTQDELATFLVKVFIIIFCPLNLRPNFSLKASSSFIFSEEIRKESTEDIFSI